MKNITLPRQISIVPGSCLWFDHPGIFCPICTIASDGLLCLQTQVSRTVSTRRFDLNSQKPIAPSFSELTHYLGFNRIVIVVACADLRISSQNKACIVALWPQRCVCLSDFSLEFELLFFGFRYGIAITTAQFAYTSHTSYFNITK